MSEVGPRRIAAIVNRVVDDVKAVSIDIRSVRGVFGAFSLAKRVVERVESVGKELNLLGPDKKDIAIDAILALVPDRWAPDWVLRPFLGWAVEKAVEAMKARFSK